MRRRKFLAAFSGSLALWPLMARGQANPPVIGFLSTRSPEDSSYLLAAFRQGLAARGFVEGRNVVIEYRWALGQYDRLPAQAERAAKELGLSIPISMQLLADEVIE